MVMHLWPILVVLMVCLGSDKNQYVIDLLTGLKFQVLP